MGRQNQQAATNGPNGRDQQGRFTRGNKAAQGRGPRRIEADVPIPGPLRHHPGVAALWPALNEQAKAGNAMAMEKLIGLCLGSVKPIELYDEAGFEETTGYEEVDEDFGPEVAKMLRGMNAAERNILRDMLRRGEPYRYEPDEEIE